MAHVVDWDNVTREDIVRLHDWGRDHLAYQNGAGDMMDEYKASIASGTVWNPNDMSNTPPVPVHSKLDQAGRRHTVSLADIPEGEDLPPYTEWSREDLESECRERDLEFAPDASDDDLALLLLEYDDQQDAGADYAHMRKDDLKAECERRGLSAEGKVDELRARLQEDDATRNE